MRCSCSYALAAEATSDLKRAGLRVFHCMPKIQTDVVVLTLGTHALFPNEYYVIFITIRFCTYIEYSTRILALTAQTMHPSVLSMSVCVFCHQTQAKPGVEFSQCFSISICKCFFMLNLANVLTMCLLDAGEEHLNSFEAGSKFRVHAVFWIDAVGCVTKVMVMLIDPTMTFFKTGFSSPRDVASHVGKENRAASAIRALTAQFVGTLEPTLLSLFHTGR